MSRVLTGILIAMVIAMVAAQLGRADNWPPFAIALVGMVGGFLGSMWIGNDPFKREED